MTARCPVTHCACAVAYRKKKCRCDACKAHRARAERRRLKRVQLDRITAEFIAAVRIDPNYAIEIARAFHRL